MFESLEQSGRTWDERLMEGQSMRRVFLLLIVLAFALGARICVTLYKVVHLHRFDWEGELSFFVLALLFLRVGLAFYRRLAG